MNDEDFMLISKKDDVFSYQIMTLIEHEDYIAMFFDAKNKVMNFTDKILISESKKDGSNFIIKNNKTYRIEVRIPLSQQNIIFNKYEFVISQSNNENIYSDDKKYIFIFYYNNKYELIVIINHVIEQLKHNKQIF